MTTFPEASKQMKAMGDILPAATKAGLTKAAMLAKTIANREGGHMSHLGKKGTNLSATYTLSATQALVKPKPAGAWSIAEGGARPHLIGIAARAKRGKRATAFIHAAGAAHPVRGPIAHPGARGRRVWTKTILEAERVCPPVFNQTVVAGSMRRIFH